MPSVERIYYLINKYIDETANSAELDELLVLLNENSYEEAIQSQLMGLLAETTPLPGHSEDRLQAVLREIRMTSALSLADTPTISPRRWPLSRRWWAIAALFIGIAGAVWLLVSPTAVSPIADISPKYDHAPGGDKARLTLADGSSVTLDSVRDGLLARQGNVQVTKLKDGKLVYKALDEKALDEKPATALLNTLSTPRGGQYRLSLPDGSQVWLNAASSITYPIAFTGGERNVSVTGEAYFEIAPNAAKPFRVSISAPSGQEVVEVLGTDFNIKAYEDETTVTTTLLQGSIRLTSQGTAMLLKPGQQGRLLPDRILHLNTDCDPEEVMAWKNGLFHFENADIGEVMRQISRWYDVEVEFEGKTPVEKFDGEIPRDSKLTEVLKILQLSNVHFRVGEKKVTVTPV